MGLFIQNIENYFSKDSSSDLYIDHHISFLDDLHRWAPLCSAALERACFISGYKNKEVYFLSKSFIELCGYSNAEILSRSPHFLSEIIHPVDIKFINKVFEQLINHFFIEENNLNHKKYSARYNIRIQNKAGKWINLECYSYPIYTIKEEIHFTTTHAKVSTEKYTPMFQIYFNEDNKRFIFHEKKGVFLSSKKVGLKEVEIRILLNTARGLKEHEIARDMDIDLNTMKYYKKAILKKLSVNSMPEAIYYALKNKFI